jgi:tetratricopeptide (TPR) repeat protein
MGMEGKNSSTLTGLLVGLVLVAGCHANRRGDDLRALMAEQELGPSLVLGHRFGGRIQVEPTPDTRTPLEEACLLEQRGQIEEAITVLGEALEEQRDSGALYEARGALYQATGFPRAAAGDFQRATMLTPARAESWLALGQAYESLDLARQALDALAKAEQLGARGVGLRLSQARSLRALGRRGLAARHYELALSDLGVLPAEVLIEAAVLAAEDRSAAFEIERLRDNLESCRGMPVSDESWLLRALLDESMGESPREVAEAVKALEVPSEELESLTWNLLAAVQLSDGETRAEVRARLLAAEQDAARRAALENCLPKP